MGCCVANPLLLNTAPTCSSCCCWLYCCCPLSHSFGDTVLPEVQATVKAPTKSNMYKGISMCYIIIAVTYLAVAITGYWAFGATVNPFVVYSFPGPQWAITLALLLAIIQIVGCYQV